jgi:hypothetical protein
MSTQQCSSREAGGGFGNNNDYQPFTELKKIITVYTLSAKGGEYTGNTDTSFHYQTF